MIILDVVLLVVVMEGGNCLSNMLLIRGNVHVSTIISNHPAMESLKIWSVVVIFVEMAAILFRCYLIYDGRHLADALDVICSL